MREDGERPDSSGGARRAARQPALLRRWWAPLGTAVAVGFVVIVVASARDAAVPVGTSGSSSGMSMPMGRGGRVQITMRDVDGRPVHLPTGRPGVVVFVEARGCEQCVAATRAATSAVRRAGGRAALTVVSLASTTTRTDVAAFAESAGRPLARYVVDDRNGSIATMLDASGLAETLVYDSEGDIVARPEPDVPQLARALRRARR